MGNRITIRALITDMFLSTDETMKQFIPEIENNFSERDCVELLNGNKNYSYPNHPKPLNGQFLLLVKKFNNLLPFLFYYPDFIMTNNDEFRKNFWNSSITIKELIPKSKAERMELLKKNNISSNFDEEQFHTVIDNEKLVFLFWKAFQYFYDIFGNFNYNMFDNVHFKVCEIVFNYYYSCFCKLIEFFKKIIGFSSKNKTQFQEKRFVKLIIRNYLDKCSLYKK